LYSNKGYVGKSSHKANGSDVRLRIERRKWNIPDTCLGGTEQKIRKTNDFSFELRTVKMDYLSLQKFPLTSGADFESSKQSYCENWINHSANQF